MDVNVYEQMSNNLSEAEFVSIALDEFTDLVGKAQVCVYARFITTNCYLFEELIGIEPLATTTTGQDIYDKLLKILKDRKVSLYKISSDVTDGAPAMIGRIRGIVTLLRKSFEFLCAKIATIDDVMTAVEKQLIIYVLMYSNGVNFVR
ncbi:uncharacterized protein LOC124817554 isoform X1 [Hydra vulgaris]|uniref:uncharacterized protein LOC124817554 isoform X1 n=1 Tax=Hydra vulgaris TaxID=6087 RepID=UPI001F5FE3C3|nr:uncharacterized protein LOC124817554 [Hydra vulgaris]